MKVQESRSPKVKKSAVGSQQSRSRQSAVKSRGVPESRSRLWRGSVCIGLMVFIMANSAWTQPAAHGKIYPTKMSLQMGRSPSPQPSPQKGEGDIANSMLLGIDWAALGELPVQQDGRIQPLYTFANDLIFYLSGTSHFGNQSALKTLLSMIFKPDVWQDKKILLVEYFPLKEKLNLDHRERFFSLTDLQAHANALKTLMNQIQIQKDEEKLTPLEQKGKELWDKILVLKDTLEHQNLRMIPPGQKGEALWISLADLISPLTLQEYPEPFRAMTLSYYCRYYSREEECQILQKTALDPVGLSFSEAFEKALQDVVRKVHSAHASIDHASPAWVDSLSERYRAAVYFLTLRRAYVEGKIKLLNGVVKDLRHLVETMNPALKKRAGLLALEYWYTRWNPFLYAGVLYTLAFVLLVLLRIGGSHRKLYLLKGLAFGVLGAALLLQLFGLVARILIGGRAPVSNIYESLLYIPFGVVLFGLIFSSGYKNLLPLIAATFLASFTLVFAQNLPLSKSVHHIMPVLKSYWLIIHVHTIVLSYGAFALAMVLGHVYGFRLLWGLREEEPLKNLAKMITGILIFGVVLLGAGIILGALWANESWGRYWGWDPKETWALITLLCYVLLIHARKAGWLRDFGYAFASILCFGVVLMTYYGVNFFMVGLHSYAGADPAVHFPLLLKLYIAFELLFLFFMLLQGFQSKRGERDDGI